MAQAVDLITYGAGEGLYYTFHAIASLFHGGESSFMGQLFVVVSSVVSVMIVARMAMLQRLDIPIKWVFINTLTILLLTGPTTPVIIIDKVTGFRTVVANVPSILALPAGYISQIGYAVADQIDTAFQATATVPGHSTLREVLTAKRRDVAMSSRIISSATNFTFVSHDMAHNMREFVKECVYYDVALGRKYSVSDLKNTDDIWKLISERASPNGGLIYRSDEGNNEFITCRQAVDKINAKWPQERQAAFQFYGKKLFPYGTNPTMPNPSNLLRENLQDAYNYMADISKDADEIMQQQIMRNAIEDGFIARASQDGALSAIQGYATVKAEANQNSVYAIQGNIAQKAISHMKIVIEIIFYSMFPFVAIMLLMPGGFIIFRTYFTALLWLQSWAPLYSVLNMVMHVYGRAEALGASATLTGNAVTFDTIPALGVAGDSVSLYAGYAMASIPFLSWGLFRYGGGALAQLATHLGAPIQSASSMAASEATTGNISQGVRQFDSMSRNLVTSFQTNENASIGSGQASWQTSSGSRITSTINGNPIIDRAASISRLGIGINNRESLSSSMSEQAQNSLSKAETASQNYGEALSSSYSQVMDYRNSYGTSIANDKTIGMEDSTNISRSYQELDSATDALAKHLGFEDRHALEKAKQNTVFGNISGTISTKDIPGLNNVLKAFGVSAGGGVGYRHERRSLDTDTTSSNASDSHNQTIQLVENFSKALDGVNRAYQSDSVRESSDQTAHFAENLNSSLNNAHTYRSEMQESLSAAQSWQESANLVNTSSVDISDDVSQDFVNFAANLRDKSGWRYGATGVESVLQDPEMRHILINEYVKTHKDEIVNHFQQNKPINEADLRLDNSSQDVMQQKVFAHNTVSESEIHGAVSEKGLQDKVDISMRSHVQSHMNNNFKDLNNAENKSIARKDDARIKASELEKRLPVEEDN